jgi:hypothetical protein
MLKRRRTVAGPVALPEVVLNLWYFEDEETNAVYRLAGRSYALIGTDDEKLTLLHTLAKTDFHIAKIHPVPKRYVTVVDGQNWEGVTGPDIAVQDPASLFKEVIDEIESELPQQMRAVDGEPSTYKLKIPENPLMVCTCVIERTDGTLQARVARDPRASK